MASSSMITLAAGFCLLAASAVVAVPPATIFDTCKSAGEQEALCLNVLASNPAAKTPPVDTRALAHAALQLAGENVTKTAAQLDKLFDSVDVKNKSLDLQRCIEDCNERYASAAVFLNKASSKLDAGSFDEASVLIGGAQSVIKLCQRTCQGVPKGEQTVSNQSIDAICSVAAAITRLLLQH